MGRVFPGLDALDRPARLLGLFAHPDDELFCAGGLFSEMSSRGASIRIVAFTRGEAGQIRDASIATRSTLGQVRAGELLVAAEALGVSDVVCHDRGDGTLAGQSIDELVEMARIEISQTRPDLIVTFGPDGGYGHPDHIRMSEVATLAGVEAGVPVYHAAFPHQSVRLIDLLVAWLHGMDDRFRGTTEFAHGLMMFADGSSVLGLASDHMDIGFYPAGTYIVEQGEASDKLFLVLSGEVDVLRESNGGTQHVNSLGPGSFFGESGLATDAPRNAHVVAKSAVTCFVLSPAKPNNAAGRGTTSQVAALVEGEGVGESGADFEIDVRTHASAKMRALAAHRSQYGLSAEMFPQNIVEELFGTERFNRA